MVKNQLPLIKVTLKFVSPFSVFVEITFFSEAVQNGSCIRKENVHLFEIRTILVVEKG